MSTERFKENPQAERFNAVYDSIQDVLWQYLEFTPEEMGEIVQDAVREHYDNYGNPGAWDRFLKGVIPQEKNEG